MFKIFGNGYFVIVLSFDNRFLIPIIMADICFFDMLEYILAKAIDGLKYKVDVVLDFTEAYKIIGMDAPDVL